MQYNTEVLVIGEWGKNPQNPLLERGELGEFDHFNIHAPMIVYHNNQYWLFYSGDRPTINILDINLV